MRAFFPKFHSEKKNRRASRWNISSNLVGTWASLCPLFVACVSVETAVDSNYAPGIRKPASDQAPTISAISNQSVTSSVASSVAFTIADEDTAASNLTVAVSAGNSTLLPSSGLVLSGAGSSRSLSITSGAGQTGSTTVNITVSDGSQSATRSFLVTVSGQNLETSIEMFDFAATWFGGFGASTFESSRTRLNTNDYDGTVTYTWEVIAYNGEGTTLDINLRDGTDTTVATITVPTGSVYTRLSTTFTPTTGADTYRVRFPALGFHASIRVPASRIRIRQVGATKTVLVFPLITRDSTAVDQNAAYVDTHSTDSYSQSDARYFSIFRKNDSAFGSISASGSPWGIEFITSVSHATSGVQAALFNLTTGNRVTEATSTTHSNTTATYEYVTFGNSATNFTDGQDFEVRFQRSIAGLFGVIIYRAALRLTLNPLTKGESVFRVGIGASTAASMTLEYQRNLVNLSFFTNPTAYFQTIGSVTVAGGGTNELYDHGTNDSGTAGSTTVTGSSNTYGTTRSRLRSSSISLTDGNRVFGGITRTAGTVSHTSSEVVIGFGAN